MSYIPGIIEQYEKLFGIIAIEKGFVSPDDFVQALTVQAKENNGSNEQRFLREILLDQNIMSVEQICEVCDVIYHWINGPVQKDDPPLVKRRSRTLSLGEYPQEPVEGSFTGRRARKVSSPH